MSKRAKLSLLLLVPFLGGSYWPTTNDDDVKDGQAAFQKGAYSDSVEAFRDALRGDGERARLHYNLGTALYQVASHQSDPAKRKADLNRAIAELGQASKSASAVVREMASYNLGNAYFLQGSYELAISTYRIVLMANPDHDDARHNLELAWLAQRNTLANRSEAQGQTGGEPKPTNSKPGDSKSSKPKKSRKPPDSPGRATNTPATGESKPATARPRPSESPPEDSEPVESRIESEHRTGIAEKLDALERRSSTLRRLNMRRKTEARVRPGARSGVDR